MFVLKCIMLFVSSNQSAGSAKHELEISTTTKLWNNLGFFCVHFCSPGYDLFVVGGVLFCMN